MGSCGLAPVGGGTVAAGGRGRAGEKLYIIDLLCQSGGRGALARGLPLRVVGDVALICVSNIEAASPFAQSVCKARDLGRVA